jgi:drug/metabolite transporter (DMT)-like permease
MKNQSLAYLYVMTAVTAWGTLYVVNKFVLGMVPPFTALFLRYLVAAMVLLLVLWRRGWVKIERADYKIIFFIGAVGYFVGVGALNVGIKLSNASLASLLNSMNPVFIILFAVPVLKEKITVYKLISIAAAVLGAYIIIGGVHGSNMVVGGLVNLFSVLAWSFASVVSKRVTQKYHAIAVTAYAMLVALCFLLPTALVEMAFYPKFDLFQPAVLGSVVYMGLVATALAYVLWNKSLSMIEAGVCSLFYPIQPMVSVLLGWLLLGERMNASFFVGAALIIGGVLLSILTSQRKKDLPVAIEQ